MPFINIRLWSPLLMRRGQSNRNVIIAFYFNDVEMLVWQYVLALHSSIFTSRNTKIIIAFIGVIFINIFI